MSLVILSRECHSHNSVAEILHEENDMATVSILHLGVATVTVTQYDTVTAHNF